MAALARRVLDDQVLAGGAVDRAAHHLDIAADPVLLVHDVVARRSRSGSIPPRRLAGSRRMSFVLDRWPARSLSVSSAVRTLGQTKPCSISPVAT